MTEALRPDRQSIVTSDGLDLRSERLVPDAPRAAMVVCHPHPLHGGNMYATVTDALFTALPHEGIATLRFNFRGVDGSDGQHDEGIGEQHDVAAAVGALAEAVPGVPLYLGGWSFGADVSACVTDNRIAGWFLVAPPLRVRPLDEMGCGADPRPKRIVTGAQDQFRDPDDARTATSGWAAHRGRVGAHGRPLLHGRHRPGGSGRCGVRRRGSLTPNRKFPVDHRGGGQLGKIERSGSVIGVRGAQRPKHLVVDLHREHLTRRRDDGARDPLALAGNVGWYVEDEVLTILHWPDSQHQIAPHLRRDIPGPQNHPGRLTGDVPHLVATHSHPSQSPSKSPSGVNRRRPPSEL